MSVIDEHSKFSVGEGEVCSTLAGLVRVVQVQFGHVTCKVLLYHLQVLHGAITVNKVDDLSCFPKQHRTANPVGCIHSDNGPLCLQLLL